MQLSRNRTIVSLFALAALGAACTKPKPPAPDLPKAEEAAPVATATPSQVQREEVLNKAIEIALNTVYFEFDSSTLTEQAKVSLDKLVEGLRLNPDVKLRVEGNSDARGSNEYNLVLSERRAAAIKEYLVGAGVKTERLVVVGNGEERPAAQGESEEIHAKNRRGDFVRI